MPRTVLRVSFLLAVACCGRVDAQMINEFAPNPPGADPDTMVELLGAPGQMLSGVLLTIESDASGATPASSRGTLNSLDTFTTTFDSNGLAVITVSDVENPSFTLVVAEAFSGDASSDLDMDDDGVIDAAALALFTNVLDAVNVPDSMDDFDTVSFGSDLGGTDLPFIGDEPQLVFRDAMTLEFFALDDIGPGTGTLFDSAGNSTGMTFADGFNTFGSANPTITTGGSNPTGDFNDDGLVNALDYLVFRERLGEMIALPNEDASPGQVAPDDFVTFVDNFGAGLPLVVSPVAIPEPATLAGLLVATAAAAFRRRR